MGSFIIYTKMDKKKQIRILTQYFYPDIATTGQLLTELAIGLTTKNFIVNVITAQPTYKKQKVFKEEIYCNVIIKRLWSTQFDKNSFIGKIVNSLTFFLSSLLYVIFSQAKSPLFIVSNPPFLPLVGVVLWKLKAVPFIFLVHDVYPDIAVKLGYLDTKNIVVKIWNIINRTIFRESAKIIVLSNSMKNIIEQKILADKHMNEMKKVEIIHNWADEDKIRPIVKSENIFLMKHGFENDFIVLYSGNLGLFYELEMVIEVARLMQKSNVKFIFIGDGGKKRALEFLVKEYNLNNVYFFPYQSSDMLPYSLTAASVALVTLEEGIEGLAMPSKLYTIMAAGKPIIAICDKNSDVENIINDAQCGFSIRHHDITRMKDSLEKLVLDQRLMIDMGLRARSYFEKKFTLNIAIHKYIEVIHSVYGN